MRYRQNTKGDILYGPPVILVKRNEIESLMHSLRVFINDQ